MLTRTVTPQAGATISACVARHFHGGTVPGPPPALLPTSSHSTYPCLFRTARRGLSSRHVRGRREEGFANHSGIGSKATAGCACLRGHKYLLAHIATMNGPRRSRRSGSMSRDALLTALFCQRKRLTCHSLALGPSTCSRQRRSPRRLLVASDLAFSCGVASASHFTAVLSRTRSTKSALDYMRSGRPNRSSRVGFCRFSPPRRPEGGTPFDGP